MRLSGFRQASGFGGPLIRNRTTPGGVDHVCDEQNSGKLARMNPEIMQFFDAGHLPAHLRGVSEPFGALAAALVERLPANEQRAQALTLLLQAKDAAVRAKLTT